MLPCCSCGKPMTPDQDIVYWAEYPSGDKEFTHYECGLDFFDFASLRGYPRLRHRLRSEWGTTLWSIPRTFEHRYVLHRLLAEYENDLIQKGLLPNDKEKTQASSEEDECSRQVP
jgi:hypothetical protein